MARFDLARLRKTLKITQKELAETLNITQGFLSSVENGRNPFPDDRVDDLRKAYPQIDLSDYEGMPEPKSASSIGSDNWFSQIHVNDPETFKAFMEFVSHRNNADEATAQDTAVKLTQCQERLMSLSDELEKTRKEKYNLMEENLRLKDLLRKNGIEYSEKQEKQ